MACEYKVYKVAVSRKEMKKWETEVDALPARKQKSWKGFLGDKWGVRTIVRFRDGAFYNFISEEKVCNVLHEARSRGEKWVVPNDRWVRIMAFEDGLEESETVLAYNANAARLVDTAGTADFDETFRDIVDSNHTGNHTSRNHPISVLTAAGQPVRG